MQIMKEWGGKFLDTVSSLQDMKLANQQEGRKTDQRVQAAPVEQSVKASADAGSLSPSLTKDVASRHTQPVAVEEGGSLREKAPETPPMTLLADELLQWDGRAGRIVRAAAVRDDREDGLYLEETAEDEAETQTERPKKELSAEQMAELAGHYKAIIRLLGDDPGRDGVLKTPMRAAQGMAHLTRGYRMDLETITNGALFECDNADRVELFNISFHSFCEHHLLPFSGLAHIAYLPGDKVLGVSKLARITEMYACRFQIQEQLTWQIAEGVQKAVDARGVGVVLDGSHSCMGHRGVGKPGATMRSRAFLGDMKTDAEERREFLDGIPKAVSHWQQP